MTQTVKIETHSGDLGGSGVEIEYKGYVAKILFSPETDSFRGEVLGGEDLIAFHLSDPKEALVVMQQVIESYLQQMAFNEGV